MIPAPFRLAALCLVLGVSPGAFAACPAGQVEICFNGCLCVPEFERVKEDVVNLTALSLERWILQSRATALSRGTRPVPPAIREQLLSYYDRELLDAVRFRVGGHEELDVATAMLQNPDVQAVTLVDVVVFRNAEDAELDVALWAHELHHVLQYRQWGSAGFAQRYTRDFEAVEGPAYDVQLQVARDIRRR